MLRRMLSVLTPLVLLLVADVGGAGVASGQPVVPVPVPPDDPARGLVYDGLTRLANDPVCPGAFRLALARAGDLPCTHGPDPVPADTSVEEAGAAVTAAGRRREGGGDPSAEAVACEGDGTSGYRVQLIYARSTSAPDTYATTAPQIQQWAGDFDAAVDDSAAKTGGSRQIRFVHDAGCQPVVDRVILGRRGDANLGATINELRSQGYDRSDRKYLVFVESSVYCGIAQVSLDDSPGQTNVANGDPRVPGMVARVDRPCWDPSQGYVGLHELAHVMGAVQTSAPNATPGFHCTDEYDVLCYRDAPGVTLRYLCPPAADRLLDCNDDDYFSTDPRPGTYLANRWNLANSRFLLAGGSTPPTTSPPTTSPPTTSPDEAPSAPRNLTASRVRRQAAVQLSWLAPASTGSSALTGYRLYRGTSASSLTLLTTLGPGEQAYRDTAVSNGNRYYYALSATNAAGEGPRSNQVHQLVR